MLKVDDVSVSYGKSQVVYNVSFEIKDDEKLILLGRNGVGKTTLLKSIIGLLPAKTGDISLNSDKRSEERRVGKECVSTCRYRW